MSIYLPIFIKYHKIKKEKYKKTLNIFKFSQQLLKFVIYKFLHDKLFTLNNKHK